MKELVIKDKQKYLEEHYPFKGIPKLTDKLECIHCNSTFTVRDYKVFITDDGFEMLCCPNFQECGGTVIDWWEIDNIRID
jgi:hypothetical protein